MKTVILLLTGCINPNGMPFTQLTDTSERQKQYVDAIHFYISNTDCKVVFCENSNTDISSLINNTNDRLEALTFPGNQDKQRGKGYGEAEIIEYALSHSSFILEDCIIIKITGRLFVNNICQIIDSLKYEEDFVTCLFHSNLKFADSRIFCGTTAFFREFLKNKDQINDSKDIFFEHVLASTVVESPYRFIPFTEEPLISGISGSTGEKYQIHFPNKRTRILYKCYAWKQLYQINAISSYRHPTQIERLIINFNILKCKLLLLLIKVSQLLAHMHNLKLNKNRK